MGYLSARFPRWPAIDAALSSEGWKLITLLRLSPVVPWNVLNYALSVTGASPSLVWLPCPQRGPDSHPLQALVVLIVVVPGVEPPQHCMQPCIDGHVCGMGYGPRLGTPDLERPAEGLMKRARRPWALCRTRCRRRWRSSHGASRSRTLEPLQKSLADILEGRAGPNGAHVGPAALRLGRHAGCCDRPVHADSPVRSPISVTVLVLHLQYAS